MSLLPRRGGGGRAGWGEPEKQQTPGPCGPRPSLGADGGMGVCARTLEEATQSRAGNCPQQNQLIKGVVMMFVIWL